VPDHTTLSRRARTWHSPKGRQGRRIPGEGPVHVLIDSTGLQVYGAGQWLEEKHGARTRRGWRKLHLALDADSGEIVAHVMTEQDTGDASQVDPLLAQIAVPIGQFTADGAYDGKPTYDTVTSHSVGAMVVIPPRANAVERSDTERHRQLKQVGAIECIMLASKLLKVRSPRRPETDTKLVKSIKLTMPAGNRRGVERLSPGVERLHQRRRP
jgi:hypothetical protein